MTDPAQPRAVERSGLLKVRHALEYHALRGVFATIHRLPLRRAEGLARRLGSFWWVLDRRRRATAISNILRSGLRTDERSAARLGRQSVQHFALVIVESLRSSVVFDEEIEGAGFEIALPDDVLQVLEDPEQSLVIASGHFGSWEIGGQRLSQWKPVAGIARPMNNPLVEKLVQKEKPRYRFRPIPKYSTDRARFLKVLRGGNTLALLTDQHAREGGVPIDLFGHPVQSYLTAPLLHLATGVPMCFLVCRRIGPMRFRLESTPLLESTRDRKQRRTEAVRLLKIVNGHLERVVREDPDQYVWAHRFWR